MPRRRGSRRRKNSRKGSLRRRGSRRFGNKECTDLEVSGNIKIAKGNVACVKKLIEQMQKGTPGVKLEVNVDSVHNFGKECEFLEFLKLKGVTISSDFNTKKRCEEATKAAAAASAVAKPKKRDNETLGQYFDRISSRIMRGQFPLGVGLGGHGVEQIRS